MWSQDISKKTDATGDYCIKWEICQIQKDKYHSISLKCEKRVERALKGGRKRNKKENIEYIWHERRRNKLCGKESNQ